MLISAVLLAAAGAVSFALVRSPEPDPAGAAPDRVAVERCHHCGVTAPAAHPADTRR
jgi:hypothetical protein